jgi:hypothetical protein
MTRMAAQTSQQVLSRIAIGNYLLSSAGSLTPNADPLSVAQSILLAHDASELVLAALASSIGAAFKDKQKTFLMDYVNAIEEKKHLGIKLFFNELNEARVAFKHLGIPPNALHFYDCVVKARRGLDEACVACLGHPLEEVGLEALIEDDAARERYSESQLLNQQGDFKECLESLGLTFRRALDLSPFAYIVSVGEPETEAALHLLGCGVEPGMFMSLQEFLPSVDLGDKITWNLRDRGHPGNWTTESIEFCLAAVLKIILQIQHAQFRPHAIPFEYVFEDVLTAKADGVLLQSERGGFYRILSRPGGRPRREPVGELKKGQQISGHVTPAYEFDPPSKWEKTFIDNANIFVVSRPRGESLGKLEADVDLIVRADLVELSYRVMDHPDIREKFPQLFPETRPET